MKRISKSVCSILLFVLVVTLIPFSSLFSVPVIAASDIAINSTNFPDIAFRNYVFENFDSDRNGYLNSNEIQNVKEINVFRHATGVEHTRIKCTLPQNIDKEERRKLSEKYNINRVGNLYI